ncbi:MAG: HNH endonuclease [Desulfobacterales bacterium]|nr:HNH endonuclease [Desulfobacterales bacterium]
MPKAPKKPCYRCKRSLTQEKYCEKCKPKAKVQEKKRYSKDPKVKKWLNSARYKNERKQFLIENPYCCSEGCTKLSNILDHRIPHKGDYDLFWDKSNWDPKCKSCHDRKTASKDGGFGNPRR